MCLLKNVVAATGGDTWNERHGGWVFCDDYLRDDQVHVFNATSFATALGTWAINGTNAAASFTEATTGPATDTGLCTNTAGCAAFTYTFPTTGNAYTASGQVLKAFATPQNLLGATLAVTFVVYNPNAIPIQVQLFAGGGSVGGYGWSNTNLPTFAGTALTPFNVTATTVFSSTTVGSFVVANNVRTTQQFCSSDTHSIGIQLQNTAALSATVSGAVTVYIQRFVVAPPA